MMPLWVAELATMFWTESGGEEPFPRRLRSPLLGAYDIAIKELSSLSIHKVENRLAHLGNPCSSGEADRPLRACLAARGTAAWIFLDADDDPDEKTGSLAHEISHFLRHCLHPRRRAIRTLGQSITAVLDGHRDPTPSERFHALLREVPLGVHVHYLRREGGQLFGVERVIEDEADLLAWELLAPVAVVLQRLNGRADRESLVALLRRDFGMSATMASEYADWLRPEAEVSPAVVRLAAVMG